MSSTKIFVCGDIVNHTPGVGFIGERLSSMIKEADYAICNFEGPELKESQRASCPHQEPNTAAYLSDMGFDLMLLANNHITELGADGVQHSINVIKASGAECIGAGLSWEDAYRPVIRVIGDFRFGFVNVCEAQVGQYVSPNQPFGYAWMGYDNFFDDIKTLSKDVDYVIVLVHAGLEHYDVPLPEIRSLYHRICDSGASAVIGCHPHCAQGYEYYCGKPIVYSLGNFFFPYSNNELEQENISYSVRLEFKGNDDVSIIPIHHSLKDGVVDVLDESSYQVNINYLCSILEEDYSIRVNEMCVHAYKSLISHLLSASICGIDGSWSIKQRIKHFIRCTLFYNSFFIKTADKRNSLLLRLFENESYRWTIIRALNLMKTNKQQLA